MVKNPPAMQETRVRTQGREDSLEKGMTTRFSLLAWEMPWTEEPGGLQSTESQRVGHHWATNTYTAVKNKRKKKEKKKRDFIEFIPDAYFPLEYIVTLKLYNLLESYEHVPPGIL